MNKKIIIIVILTVVFLVLVLLYLSNISNFKSGLNMYFFNSGKADSCIIYNSDFAVLIDTGEQELGDTILDYLEENNIQKLNYLIITHFDKDHVGSAYKIIKKIDIDNVVQSNSPKDSKVYNKYIQALEDKSITPITLRENLNFDFGDVKFEFNPPKEEEYLNKPSNNSSLITSIQYLNKSFIFMGDAEDDRIKEFIKENNNTYDFMKFPYHGNYQESLQSLLENTKPKYTVITSSDEESEDNQTLSLLNKYSVRTYLTRNGSILLTTDGNSIKISQ